MINRYKGSSPVYEIFAEERQLEVLGKKLRETSVYSALREWYGEADFMLDFKEPIQNCQLRGTGPARHMLPIVCKHSSEMIHVTIPTILLYRIPIYENGGLVHEGNVKRLLHGKARGLEADQQVQDFIDIMARIGRLRECPKRTVLGGTATLPDFLISMKKWMHMMDISFDISCFSVDLESEEGWGQVCRMPPWRRNDLVEAMTRKQAMACRKAGLHVPDIERSFRMGLL